MNETIHKIRESEIFKHRELAQSHMSYALEMERHRVIREGRIDLLEQSLKIPADGIGGTLARDPLRNRKNMLICAITTFTRAAMDGGLLEETAYAMSDSYILSCENCRTLGEVDLLYVQAFREFTQAVADTKKRHYSARTERCLNYIHSHLHEDLTLDTIAPVLGISPCHLSRTFRKETGLSIVEYIQEERVKSAKNMLIYSDYTLSAISEYLNFANQSYFIRIFKKHVGMTPSQYRRSYQETTAW